MDARLFTFGLSAVILPVVWLVLRPKRPYPHAIDICIVAPFLLDTAGNALDLYDASSGSTTSCTTSRGSRG